MEGIKTKLKRISEFVRVHKHNKLENRKEAKCNANTSGKKSHSAANAPTVQRQERSTYVIFVIL
jgi:hypothetical protein